MNRTRHLLTTATLGIAFCFAAPGLAQEKPEKPAKPAAKKPAKPNIKAAEAELQKQNAARASNGARITLDAMGAIKDKQTGPEMAIDGNTHSRPVMSNPPYALRIELVDKLPISDINIILSDYASEAWPKDIEVTLSDGTKIQKTLEELRPTKNQTPPRQAIPVNKEINWFEVKVLNYVEGKSADGSKTINYGGIGEIEAITSADLSKYLELPGANPDAPAYVVGGSAVSDYSNVKVTMPVPIAKGQHPCLFMTRDEIVKWRDEIKKTERGAKTVETTINVANGYLAKPVEFPDPKIPAQMKDRGDAPAKAHGMLSRAAGAMGWAYQLTDDEKYAEKAKEILVGYAKRYPNDYQEHKGVNGSDSSKVMAQRLSEAMWLLPLIQSYDMIHDAKCMTDADRQLIEKDLIREAITFINGKRTGEQEVAGRQAKDANWRTAEPGPGKAVGNWVNFYNACFIQGGLVLGDQDWVDVGAADTRLMIAHGIGDDGMWKEGAIGYQFFARMALVACMEPLARHGVDIYGFSHARVKNLFDSPYKYAYPDNTAPGINDSGRVKIGGDWQAMAYDYGWLRYNDPNYGAAVNNAPRQIFQSDAVYFPTVIYETLPEKPLEGVGSLVFEGLGYAIMRGTENGNPTFTLLNVGKSAGPHDHPEKLNLLIYADGDELTGEPNFYRYEDSRHGDWTMPSIAHFTVAVDESSEAHTDAKLLAFSDNGAVKVMRGVCDTAYPAVGLDRTVVQMPGYIADFFYARSPNQHTYDYPLCFRGTLDALGTVDEASLKPMSANKPGYKLIKTKDPVKVDGIWTGTWAREAVAAKDSTGEGEDKVAATPAKPANEVKVMVLPAAGTQVFIGKDVDGRDRAIVRREAKDVVFASIIDPYKASDAVKTAEEFKVDGPVPGYGLRVKRSDGGTDLIVVRFDPQTGNKLAGASTFDGGTTDALVTVVRLDAGGKVIESGIVGGTNLKYGDKTVTSETPGVKWAK